MQYMLSETVFLLNERIYSENYLAVFEMRSCSVCHSEILIENWTVVSLTASHFTNLQDVD